MTFVHTRVIKGPRVSCLPAVSDQQRSRFSSLDDHEDPQRVQVAQAVAHEPARPSPREERSSGRQPRGASDHCFLTVGPTARPRCWSSARLEQIQHSTSGCGVTELTVVSWKSKTFVVAWELQHRTLNVCKSAVRRLASHVLKTRVDLTFVRISSSLCGNHSICIWLSSTCCDSLPTSVDRLCVVEDDIFDTADDMHCTGGELEFAIQMCVCVKEGYCDLTSDKGASTLFFCFPLKYKCGAHQDEGDGGICATMVSTKAGQRQHTPSEPSSGDAVVGECG